MDGDHGHDALEHQLTARERQRRDALVGDDMGLLADLVTDDLVHVHTTGAVHGKAELLEHAGRHLRFLEVERGPLLVRALGEHAAVMTGTMTNTVRRRDQPDERVKVKAFVTQLWVRDGEQWKIKSFHATRQSEPA